MKVTGMALEHLGIDPKYCINCICRMMCCKGKVCELARTMAGVETNPDEICKDLALEPTIATWPKEKGVVEQIVGFTWTCRQYSDCQERDIWCPVKEERIKQIFFKLIKGYNEKKDYKDHALILSDDLVLLINYNPGGSSATRGWTYRVIQAERW